jgi:hypothetical protein
MLQATKLPYQRQLLARGHCSPAALKQLVVKAGSRLFKAGEVREDSIFNCSPPGGRVGGAGVV